jgi:hypothetical protein
MWCLTSLGPVGRLSQQAFTSCQWQKAVAKRGSAKRTQPAVTQRRRRDSAEKAHDVSVAVFGK